MHFPPFFEWRGHKKSSICCMTRDRVSVSMPPPDLKLTHDGRYLILCPRPSVDQLSPHVRKYTFGHVRPAKIHISLIRIFTEQSLDGHGCTSAEPSPRKREKETKTVIAEIKFPRRRPSDTASTLEDEVGLGAWLVL